MICDETLTCARVDDSFQSYACVKKEERGTEVGRSEG